MSLSRRTFLASSAYAGAMLSTGTLTAKADHHEKPKAELKISCQEWIAPDNTSFAEKIEFFHKNGITGIELGGNGLANRVESIKKELDGSGVAVSAICAGFQGVPISHDKATREKCAQSCKEILEAAGELNSTGLIIVPAFNGQTELGHVEGRKILLDFLADVGETAQKAGTRILLEPLNRQEAWFLRQLHDAAAICRDVNNPGIRMMGDFYHMGIEEVCEYSAFLGVRDYLHHVHLASRPKRQQPGFDPNDDFRPGFRALKEIGYNDYCSFECGITGNKEEEFPKMVAYIKQHWDEA